MRFFKLSLASVLLIGFSSSAFADFIVNGSFEDDLFDANGNYELGLIGNDVNGWFIPDGNGVYPWGLQNGAFGASTPFGNQFFVLGLYSTQVEYSIQQTMNGLVVGNTYDVEFSIASEQACCAQVELSYLDGSSTAAQIFTATNSGNFWTDWSTLQTSFVATSSSVTLQFQQFFGQTSGFDLGLDNVSVVDAVSVPEPGTIALLGIGLAGMGFMRRRRKV
jgi:hypothetical protein